MKVIRRNKFLNSTCAIGLIFLLFSCSSTRHLDDDETLYTRGKVTVESEELSKKTKSSLKEELEPLLRPVPNSKFLGMRTKLFFYNLAGDKEKDSGIRRWIRNKLGEPPVLFSQVDMEYNRSILANRMENNGYFHVKVSSDSIDDGKQKKGVEYTVHPGTQYLINQVTFLNDSTPIQQLIARGGRWTRLKQGTPYSLDVIKNERVRYDNYLKNQGYYFFSDNDLLVQVDSTVGNHQVDLFVKVKEKTPELALSPYTIDKIYIYSDYQLSDNNLEEQKDSAYSYKDFSVIDSKRKFKPSIYDRTIYLENGKLYNRNDHNLSLNRLVSLGIFKFVKNQFVISDSVQHKLDAYYYLTPDKPKAIRLELLGKTNSASYNGVELNINWMHKNAFKGAELFSVSLYGGADFQMSSRNKGYNVYKIGTEMSLTWPKVITPWEFKSSSGYVPKTRAMIGVEYLERTKLYSLTSFKGAWGYLWKENTRKEHQLNLFEINYVSPNNVTDLYREYAEGNPSLERILDKQLIFGPTYTYTYTNTMQQYKKHTFYYRGMLDFSGNITGLLMGADVDKGKEKSVLGVPFSQYIKTEHDFRYYLKLDRTSQLVTRLHGGVGFAYGNSKNLPYTKQFYIGGTNSVRAFRARTLGPGTFDPNSYNSRFIPDQSADMLLEMNLEYRKKLFSIVHGALFIDAGNIWNLNEVDDRPGGEISGDFYKEIAVGAGAGLRFDITFLVLRLDFAFPLRIPYNNEGERWVIKDIKFGDSAWRKENLMFNFAIGYPF